MAYEGHSACSRPRSRYKHNRKNNPLRLHDTVRLGQYPNNNGAGRTAGLTEEYSELMAGRILFNPNHRNFPLRVSGQEFTATPNDPVSARA